MEIWLIIDGAKAGPFADYEIRSKITAGELGPDQPAWHEGLEKWTKLGELPNYADTFAHLATEPEQAQAPDSAKESPFVAPPRQPPPLPGSLGIIRRFFARWFDLFLWSAIWWGGARLAGRDLAEMMLDHYMLAFQYLPWLFIEASLLHLFGTTPGKWILGLRVEYEEGGKLSVGKAFSRSLRVWVLGIGMGLPLLALLSQLFSLFFLRQLGKTLWDTSLGTTVRVKRIHPARIALFAILFFGVIEGYNRIIYPSTRAVLERTMRDAPPELREFLQRFVPPEMKESP